MEETNPSIDRSEHNNTAKAKRVLPLAWNGSGYTIPGLTLAAGVDYNYIDVQQTSSTVDTYVFKTGGSGGTTVRTITVTYTSSSKSDIDSVAWS